VREVIVPDAPAYALTADTAPDRRFAIFWLVHLAIQFFDDGEVMVGLADWVYHAVDHIKLY
jgi:hypothetical protein